MIKSVMFKRKLEELKNVVYSYDLSGVKGNDSMIKYSFSVFERDIKDAVKRIDFSPLDVDFLCRYSVENGKLFYEIKSKLKDSLAISKRISVPVDSNMFSKLIKTSTYFVIESIVENKNSTMNIKRLNEEMERICKKCEIEMKFTLGGSIISDIYDNYIEIGLNTDQATRIPDLSLFDYINRDLYSRALVDALKIRQTPAQVLKYENPLLEDLGVSTSSRFDIMLTSRYRKDVRELIEGEGFLIDGEGIAVVSKTYDGMIYKMKPINMKSYLFM